MTEHKISYYITKSKELNNIQFNKSIRVAILSSFTINGIEETLKVKCAEKNIECITYLGSYNQYNQNILDNKSKLYEFQPNITFLLVDSRTVLGEFFYSPYSLSISERKDFVDKKSKELLVLIDTFSKKTNSTLVIANLAIPTYSPYGIFETKTQYGLQQMVNEINHKLSESIKNNDSVYLYNFNGFVSMFGENNIFDFKQFLFGDIKIALDYIPYFTNDLLGYIIALLGLTRRCIVLDLDNTLWGGVVGEDGFDGIRLGKGPPGNAYVEFQKILLSLQKRGVLLAINSKNNPEDALKVINEHPDMILRREHFTCLKINWNDKVSNMKEISKEINFGLDYMVFFDDDPVNREFIQNNLPQVLTVELPKDPAQYAKILQNMKEFNTLNITNEDIKRGTMYIQQQKRKELENSSIDLEGFLKNLNLKISILPADKFTIPRISQLTLKTNQFNLTTKRYQEEEIRMFSKDNQMIVGCAQVEDKFGDNGITSVFIIKNEKPEEWTLDTFLLSCRVMGREVEKGILDYIIKKAKENKIKRIKAEYIPTQKNKPIEDFLQNCGFKKEGNYWFYNCDEEFKIPDFLKISMK